MPKEAATALSDMLVVDALNRMDTKLDKLDDRMDGMASTLVKQQASLDEHIKRSDLLEKKIDLETRAIKEDLPKEVENQIRLQRNKFLISAAKILGVIAGLGGGGFGLKELFTVISKLWGGE